MRRKFSVVTTFSGCGGSSLGYTWAGGKVLLGVEWDKNAVETYRSNFPKTKIYHGDICKLTVADALRMAGLKAGELDVFDGSPPCQGFSTAGKQNFGDERNQLFREYVRLLRGLRPKVFVMENVSGMVKGKMKIIFAEILRELKGSGYRVSAKLLNSQYFNVPQSRERMIFIGVRNDLPCVPSHPTGRGKPISAGTAVRGVAVDADEIQMLLDAGQKYIAYADWHRLKPGQARTKLGETSGFSCRRIDPRRPCPTVTKNEGNIALHGMMHWDERRRFTVNEYKRFSSFPDDFRFSGSWSDAVQRIGNSVPPRFMQAIAEHIRDEILAVCI
jgi:DNA (cytosine-5)-methyltransferase 1